MQYIYQIRNKLNDKFYVGRSKDVIERLRTHLRMLVRNNHHSIHFQNAWNKYDEDVWEFRIYQVIDTGDDKEDERIATEIEQKFLDDLLKTNTLYNRSTNAKTGALKGEDHPFYGMHPKDWLPEGTWERMIENMLGSQYGEDNPFYGRHHSEETKAILREKCANFGEKNGFYGKTHTEETLSKIKDAKQKYSKPVMIDGVPYRSIREASRLTNYTRGMIKLRLNKSKYENVYYITNEEYEKLKSVNED